MNTEKSSSVVVILALERDEQQKTRRRRGDICRLSLLFVARSNIIIFLLACLCVCVCVCIEEKRKDFSHPNLAFVLLLMMMIKNKPQKKNTMRYICVDKGERELGNMRQRKRELETRTDVPATDGFTRGHRQRQAVRRCRHFRLVRLVRGNRSAHIDQMVSIRSIIDGRRSQCE